MPGVLVVLVFVHPSAAQTTKPPAELAKENAELRAYVEKLEARVAELEGKLKELRKASPRAEVRPFNPRVPAPYGFELPQSPFKLPTPAPSQPRSELRIPAPGQQVPDNWRRREFNGQEYYLIPLR
jgi:hypothetical protein